MLPGEICKEVRGTDKAGAEAKQRCGFSWKLASAWSYRAAPIPSHAVCLLESISHLSWALAVFTCPWRGQPHPWLLGEGQLQFLLRTVLGGIISRQSIKSLNRKYPQRWGIEATGTKRGFGQASTVSTTYIPLSQNLENIFNFSLSCFPPLQSNSFHFIFCVCVVFLVFIFFGYFPQQSY